MKITAQYINSLSVLFSFKSQDYPQTLVQFISNFCSIDYFLLMCFRKDRPPKPLYLSSPASEEEPNLYNYVTGPYLLDPFYQLFLSTGTSCCEKLSAISPGRFKQSAYYKTYYKNLNIKDEIGYLFPVDNNNCIHLCLNRQSDKNPFNSKEVSLLKMHLVLFETCLLKYWQDQALSVSSSTNDSHDMHVHEILSDTYSKFGCSILTSREQEVLKLLLRGFSSQEVALLLEISSATVVVHRRNIYRKFAIGSQSELFSLFLDSLWSVGGNTNFEDPWQCYLAETSQ